MHNPSQEVSAETYTGDYLKSQCVETCFVLVFSIFMIVEKLKTDVYFADVCFIQCSIQL